jgi:hypothetical protein
MNVFEVSAARGRRRERGGGVSEVRDEGCRFQSGLSKKILFIEIVSARPILVPVSLRVSVLFWTEISLGFLTAWVIGQT